jgi:hypothetical protein
VTSPGFLAGPAANPRAIVLSALIVGLLWFAMAAQSAWTGALGIEDIPGAELFAALFVVTAMVGYLLPGPMASVAAGVGGLIGVILGVWLTGELDSFKDPGFSIVWLTDFSLPAAGHTLGTAIRHAVDRRRVVTAE